jgi:putative DNA primase/helicase
VIGTFLAEYTVRNDNSRLSTSALYAQYTAWAKGNGYHALNSKNLVTELRRRFDVRRDGAVGNVVVGFALSFDPAPF